jgi:hypothetical protein
MGRWGCVRNGNRDLVDALPRPEGPRLARTDVEQPGCPSFNIGGNFRFGSHFACSEREKRFRATCKSKERARFLRSGLPPNISALANAL